MNKKKFHPSLIRFSWIDDNVAGFSYPASIEAMEFLREQGITDIISLSKDPAPIEYLKKLGITVHHLPITDFGVPDTRTIQSFIDTVNRVLKKKGKIGIHCKYGIGRTGTMIAVYLIEFKKMDPRDAIIEVRRKRPGSIEVRDQEYFLLTYKRKKT